MALWVDGGVLCSMMKDLSWLLLIWQLTSYLADFLKDFCNIILHFESCERAAFLFWQFKWVRQQNWRNTPWQPLSLAWSDLNLWLKILSNIFTTYSSKCRDCGRFNNWIVKYKTFGQKRYCYKSGSGWVAQQWHNCYRKTTFSKHI